MAENAADGTFPTEEDALQEARRVLGVLDSLAEEERIAESFVPEALVQSSAGGWWVDKAAIIYGVSEMGERHLAHLFAAEIAAKRG